MVYVKNLLMIAPIHPVRLVILMTALGMETVVLNPGLVMALLIVKIRPMAAI